MSDRKLPTLAEIEQRAYELYIARGREDGQALEDWLAAEKELTHLSERSVPPTTRSRAARGTN
jgi:Protein of unknown function (DUF2934)